VIIADPAAMLEAQKSRPDRYLACMFAKSFFSPIGIASAAFLLVGCSGGSSSDDPASPPPPPPVTEPAPDPRPLPIAVPPPDSSPPTSAAPEPQPDSGGSSTSSGDWTSGGVNFDPVRAEQIRTSTEFRAAHANCRYVGCSSSGAPAGNRSRAFELHNLHVALSSGKTGAGQLVAIVDSGFRTTHQEFAGKTIHQSGGLPSADHGTHVASLIAGVQDGRGMHGVAPNANLHLTAINPTGGTNLDLANVIAGTQNASSLGAVAQNNSWGFSVSAADFDAHLKANPGRSVAQGLNATIGNYGSSQWQAYLDALDGFQQGGVVVWALSNDETMTSGDTMAALPYFDGRLQGAWIAAANGYFETDGSGNINNAIRLSAACGLAARFCLAGDGTTTAADASSDTGYSAGTGTSYVAPQIAGTVALLAEAFPDLTPEEWTKRLLASADNSWFAPLGVPVSGSVDFGNGVSHAYSGEWGHGVLDIAAALSPIGAISVLTGEDVVTSARTELSDSVVATPDSFGNGLESALTGTEVAVFDGLNRSYAVEGSALVTTHATPMISDLVASVSRPQWGALPSHRNVLSVLPRSGRASTSGGLALLKSADGLFETTSAVSPRGSASVFSLAGDSITFTSTHRTGALSITAVGFAGEGAASASTGVSGTGLNLALGEESRISVGASYVGEQGGLLGLSENDAFGWGNGSAIGTVHLGLDQKLGSNLEVFGRLEYGSASQTGVASGLVTSMSDVRFSGFQVGARMESVFSNQDSLQFSLAQPLRIESGSMALQLPTGRTADGTIEHRQVNAELAPDGRELDLGLDYEVPVGTGALQVGLQYRLDARHVRAASAMGVAVSFGQSF
jgi:subtilase-type serine protease